MPPSNTYFWCSGHDGDGHVVGQLTQVQHDGKKVAALYLYLEAQDGVSDDKVILGHTIVGDAPSIRCTRCANVTKWYASKSAQLAAFEKLMSHYPRGYKAILSEKEKQE